MKNRAFHTPLLYIIPSLPHPVSADYFWIRYRGKIIIILFIINSFKSSNGFKISIWSIDRTLTGTTTLDQNGPESIGNEGVLYIPQSFRTGTSSLDDLVSYSGHLFGGRTPLDRCSWSIQQRKRVAQFLSVEILKKFSHDYIL